MGWPLPYCLGAPHVLCLECACSSLALLMDFSSHPRSHFKAQASCCLSPSPGTPPSQCWRSSLWVECQHKGMTGRRPDRIGRWGLGNQAAAVQVWRQTLHFWRCLSYMVEGRKCVTKISDVHGSYIYTDINIFLDAALRCCFNKILFYSSHSFLPPNVTLPIWVLCSQGASCTLVFIELQAVRDSRAVEQGKEGHVHSADSYCGPGCWVLARRVWKAWMLARPRTEGMHLRGENVHLPLSLTFSLSHLLTLTHLCALSLTHRFTPWLAYLCSHRSQGSLGPLNGGRTLRQGWPCSVGRFS